MSRSFIKTLYALLGIGAALAFLGHGILGAKGSEKFVELVTASYDKVLGDTMSVDTATSIVNVIGWVDIGIAVGFVALVVGALRDRPFAFSTPAMVLFGWAAVWGLLTAVSRFTATLNGAEIWDVVERGPNYLLPLAAVYLIHRMRSEESATKEERVESKTQPRLSHPSPAH